MRRVDSRDGAEREHAARVQSGIVLGLALLLRVFAAWVALGHGPKGTFFSRGLEMSFMADSLAHGHGLSSPFGGATGPTAMFAPVYPLLMAGLFRVFGSYSMGAAMGIVAIQIVANLVAIWLMMWVARRQFDGRVALVAGLVWTLSPPLWWLPTIYWDTTITVCLLLGVVALALRVVDEPGGWLWECFGMLCGATALFNPALVPTLVGVFAVVCWRGRGGRLKLTHAVVAAVVFVLVFSVWPIRNARVLHAFVPLRTAPGLDLWMGNHAGASGYLETAQFPIYDHRELAEYEEMGEVAYTHEKGVLAMSYIEEHPGIFATLTARRVVRFWLGTGTRDGSALFVVHAVATTALGLVGVWMLVRRRRWMLVMLFAVPLVLFPLPYYVTHAEFRFRIVIDQLLTLLGAYAVVEMGRKASALAVTSTE
jgi:4-amino-4-deoxy-L-arabinose transferase-like glycosyltransferase